jgi:hypothetical protein
MTLRMARAFSAFSVAIFGLLAACSDPQRTASGGAAGTTSSGGVAGNTAPGGGQMTTTAGTSATAGNASGGSPMSTAGRSNGAAGDANEGGAGSTPDESGIPDDATVVLFLIDGLQTATIQTGIANGASNIEFLIDNGVTAETVNTTSPAARAQLPDASLPWGNATSGNVAAHTGCHLFESNQMDDIFLAARAGGIKSVFAGGDANYSVFKTPDFFYSGNIPDADVAQHAIDHLASDHVRLIRLHFQRIRDFWEGPSSETTATSTYIQHLVEVDGLLGKLRQALEQQGVWNHTYVILSSDHGMGQTAQSEHPPSVLSSWKNVMIFYGPNVKKGATIPYAETPDIAVMTNHLLKLPALRGHLDPAVTLTKKGATGTLLTNIFEGEPAELEHPRYVEKYLNTGTYTGSGTEYADYRLGMLEFLQ